MSDINGTDIGSGIAAFIVSVATYFAGRKSGRNADAIAQEKGVCLEGLKHENKLQSLIDRTDMRDEEIEKRFKAGDEFMKSISDELKTVRSSVDRMIGWIEAK